MNSNNHVKPNPSLMLGSVVVRLGFRQYYKKSRDFFISLNDLQALKPQPQLSSTELGLTWLLLFIPPHHHTTTRNSTATRINNPRGLKFFMRPHLTKLTTTQHNFDPTIFWGMGSCTTPPPTTHPNSTSNTRSLRSTFDVAYTTTST